MMASLSTAADWMDGTLHGDDVQFNGVSIDSRTLQRDELFFAISGPNFDGHAFVDAALGRGAAAAVIADEAVAARPVIQVADTRRAIGRLARAWRRNFRARTIGLTGSNGKTTLKALVTAICETQAETLSTSGNLNNDLGVPLTLLRMRESHAYAVIEMGANHIGEIEYLTSLVEPNIVILNNAGPAHLEGFGSMDGVAEGKGEILSGVPRPDVAILNADDRYFDQWQAKVQDVELLTFALDAPATVTARNISIDADCSRFELLINGDTFPVRLALPGRHNVMNACAAAAVGWALNISAEAIVTGLERAVAVGGRLRELRGVNGSRIFDDSYNANPASVRSAAEYLVATEGHTVVVLGDMFELGEHAADMHRQLGEEMKQLGVNALYATGDLCRSAIDGFGAGGRWFADCTELAAALRKEAHEESRIIVKGSRSMQMERVVYALSQTDEVTV